MKLVRLVFAIGLLIGMPANADVRLTERDDRVQVEIDGELFTEWRHRAWVAPYLYPVIGPNGVSITRQFPMKAGVSGESQDHPWHRSLRFAHSDVNGFNFWWAAGKERMGHTVEVKLERIERITSGETGELILWNRWLGDGRLVLRERMTLRFIPLQNPDVAEVVRLPNRTLTSPATGTEVLMDYDVELHAGDKPVLFGDMKDGGLLVRVAGTMKVEIDGELFTEWRHRAWVDYSGKDASGNTVGIAMFDHPSNLRFPTHWHARTYGLLTANRFGTHHFDPKYAKPGSVSCRPFGTECPACNARGGDYTIPSGRSLTLKHRFYFHHGDARAADVSHQYQLYTSPFETASSSESLSARHHLLFNSGKEGYPRYRIPSLVVTNSGDLLAICEGRADGGGLTGNVDLVCKRSRDNGQTWSKLQRIGESGDDTFGNQSVVVDRNTGVIWGACTVSPGEHLEAAITRGETDRSTRVFVFCSRDDGKTWSEPRDITSAVKRPGWTWYGCGPGVGIQLSDGRLFFAAYHREDPGTTVRSHAIFSDDHGATWQLGGNAGGGNGEPQVLQRDDGSIYLSARTSGGPNHRSIVESRDGGKTWGGKRFDQTIYDSFCQASLLKLPAKDGKPRWLYCHPAGPGRRDLTVRLSVDEGQTWDGGSLRLRTGDSQYSSMALLQNGRVGVLYDCWENNNYQLYFTTFAPSQLTEQ